MKWVRRAIDQTFERQQKPEALKAALQMDQEIEDPAWLTGQGFLYGCREG